MWNCSFKVNLSFSCISKLQTQISYPGSDDAVSCVLSLCLCEGFFMTLEKDLTLPLRRNKHTCMVFTGLSASDLHRCD